VTPTIALLVGFLSVLACGCAAGLGWCARGERESKRLASATSLAWQGRQAANASAAVTKEGVAARAQEEASTVAAQAEGDNLDALLSEKPPA
jgi:hypothetical protein